MSNLQEFHCPRCGQTYLTSNPSVCTLCGGGMPTSSLRANPRINETGPLELPGTTSFFQVLHTWRLIRWLAGGVLAIGLGLKLMLHPETATTDETFAGGCAVVAGMIMLCISFVGFLRKR